MRLLRGLGSRLLPCGCLAGIYETYAGEVVAIIDAQGDECHDLAHAVGETMTDSDAAGTPLRRSPAVDGGRDRTPTGP
jgi:hypothetical protein